MKHQGKKKISWWDSKYSDYSHMEETDKYIILHLKEGSRNRLCFLDKFTQEARAKGKVLLLQIDVHKSVVLSIKEWENLNSITKRVVYDDDSDV